MQQHHQQHALQLIDGQVQILSRDEGVSLYVQANDLFYWACADGDDITLDELTALTE